MLCSPDKADALSGFFVVIIGGYMNPYDWLEDAAAPLAEYEREVLRNGMRRVAGVDEAGRGPLAGPIVASAVILSAPVDGVNDSKKLTVHQRESLFAVITNGDHQVGISVIDAEEIDAIGIQAANYASMAQAAYTLEPAPDFLLVDGFAIKGCSIPLKKIVKGDQKSQSIAAASIVAKVTRDRMMIEYDKRYPEYSFAKHKGYGTKLHLEAIEKYGPCDIHRKSFAPMARMLETDSLL